MIQFSKTEQPTWDCVDADGIRAAATGLHTSGDFNFTVPAILAYGYGYMNKVDHTPVQFKKFLDELVQTAQAMSDRIVL